MAKRKAPAPGASKDGAPNEQRLTPKQRAFCEFYVVCGNATEAALRAGYSSKTAAQQGAENLRKPYIARYIATHAKSLLARSSRIIDAVERQELLSALALSEAEDTADRIRAIDTLNRMTGEYIERVKAEVTHSAGVLAEVLEQLRE
jgi:phage terminase small subunit